MKAPAQKLIIDAIETDDCYFIKAAAERNYSSSSSLIAFYFDGARAEKTHNPIWLKIPNKPTIIQRDGTEQYINHRYELIDPSMASEKIPAVLKRDDVAVYDLGDYEWKWISGPYQHLRSLYKVAYDTIPAQLENVEFEFNVILKIDKIKEVVGFNYPAGKMRWDDNKTNIGLGDIRHEELDTIIFPDIVLTSRTSKLSSKDTYRIIREHVKVNIDPRWAVITSDYDFCFEVKKRIKLNIPVAYQKDISGYRARKPKYITEYRKERDVKIFEMTHDEHKYQGYTSIKGFEGKSVEDLKKNIDTFLTDLMSRINAPLCECPHCDGTGVIEQK